ncbi:MAG: magnesium/cobalt transporter CorA [Verrucomicrobia bacterium]|nr:magnesium/cobalt transporter CorA [Verrucomicrobiota bacterium]
MAREAKPARRKQRRRPRRIHLDEQPEESKPRLLAPMAKKSGMPPGSLGYVGEQRVEEVKINLIDYSGESLREIPITKASECSEYLGKSTVTWVNIVGLHDPSVIEDFGRTFNIHPLVLEDILNTGQRPKVEDHLDYLFITVKMLHRDEKKGVLAEQVSFVLGCNYLLTFQELPQDVFEAIRERVRNGVGRVREAGCDYLAYALLDAIVDHYYVVLEHLDERIEKLHEDVINYADNEALHTIHALRREMVQVRKMLWPLREMVSTMQMSESVLIAAETKPYLHDVYEHAIQIMDNVEALRDMLTSALEIHLSMISNRMNEIMRVLTIIATVFIPLTFIAGIYGMNFDNMPELHWSMGYPFAWGLMIATGIGMFIFFRRRGWL